jgi:hypothetical protein
LRGPSACKICTQRHEKTSGCNRHTRQKTMPGTMSIPGDRKVVWRGEVMDRWTAIAFEAREKAQSRKREAGKRRRLEAFTQVKTFLLQPWSRRTGTGDFDPLELPATLPPLPVAPKGTPLGTEKNRKKLPCIWVPGLVRSLKARLRPDASRLGSSWLRVSIFLGYVVGSPVLLTMKTPLSPPRRCPASFATHPPFTVTH